MIKKDQNQMFEEMYHLQNCELAMGEYYNELARKFPEERFFWEEAVADEINHARIAGKLIALVSSNINRFGLGKYRVELLKTFLDGIYNNVQAIKANKIDRLEILRIAMDYETSFVESRPYDIVISLDIEFQNFKDTYAQELSEHTQRLKSYIKQKIELISTKPIIRNTIE